MIITLWYQQRKDSLSRTLIGYGYESSQNDLFPAHETLTEEATSLFKQTLTAVSCVFPAAAQTWRVSAAVIGFLLILLPCNEISHKKQLFNRVVPFLVFYGNYTIVFASWLLYHLLFSICFSHRSNRECDISAVPSKNSQRNSQGRN